jgi:hypothetical protein
MVTKIALVFLQEMPSAFDHDGPVVTSSGYVRCQDCVSSAGDRI